MSMMNNRQSSPTGLRKVLYFHWPLAILLVAVCCAGFLMLFSVAGGKFSTWAEPQVMRFAVGFAAMIIIGFIPINVWRNMSIPAYVIGIALLVFVEYFGSTGKGAQRWIDLGFMKLQPSEMMKIALVMIVAMYYDWLDEDRVSKPLWLMPPLLLTALPMALVLNQPDLGTAILLAGGAGVIMLLAGVSLWYFAGAIGAIGGVVWAVIASKGTEFQILKDYQYRRIETFLDPSSDPLGSGYHITQSKDRIGFWWVFWARLYGRHAKPFEFLARKTHRFHFHHLSRGIWISGWNYVVDFVHVDHFLLLCHRNAEPQSVRRFVDVRGGGDVLFLL